jgi:hypothetical protein
LRRYITGVAATGAFQEAAITIIAVVGSTSARRTLLATSRVDVEFAVAVSTQAGLVPMTVCS